MEDIHVKIAPPPSYEDVMQQSSGAGYPVSSNGNWSPIAQQALPTAPTLEGAYGHQSLASPSYGAFEETPVGVAMPQPSATPDALAPELPLDSNLCPVCRVGTLEDSYSCLGLCLAIALFPIGILCCCALKTKVCNHCNTEY